MPSSFRNRFCIPDLETEGVFLKPLDAPKDEEAFFKLKTFDRVHAHHTLASARRFAYFRPFRGLIPKDALDIVLNSPYDHSYEMFPDPIDPYLQPETVGLPSWRKLRNYSEFKPAVEARANIPFKSGLEPIHPKIVGKLPYKINKYHPVVVGGVKERKHPSNVKLMNSSHHSPQTNAGYSRQDSDGNFYQY